MKSFLVDENGKLVGLITYKDITKAKDRPNSCKDEKGRLRVCAVVGIASNTMQRVEALLAASADAIVIDILTHILKALSVSLKISRKIFREQKL